jgi:uncharacterized protein
MPACCSHRTAHDGSDAIEPKGLYFAAKNPRAIVSSRTISDTILLRFRAELGAMYGNRLDRVVLFSSRARGDARPDSDYDIAVFLKEMNDRWNEFDRIADLETQLTLDTGAVIRAAPYSADAYRERSPLMSEIRDEGIDV